MNEANTNTNPNSVDVARTLACRYIEANQAHENSIVYFVRAINPRDPHLIPRIIDDLVTDIISDMENGISTGLAMQVYAPAEDRTSDLIFKHMNYATAYEIAANVATNLLMGENLSDLTIPGHKDLFLQIHDYCQHMYNAPFAEVNRPRLRG